MKKNNIVVSVVMICTGIAALVKAWDYPEQSRMIPFIYSSALIALSFLFGLRTVMTRKGTEKEDPIRKDEPIFRVFLVMAIILGYIVSIQVLGFYTSTMLFLLLFMGIMHATPWYVSIAVSVLTAVLIHFFFETLLHIPVPEGIFF